MIYVLSDIHGQYDKYQTMLEKIRFCSTDALFVLGDVVDRGPDGVRVLQDMMARPNVHPILGNHELSMAFCLRWLLSEVTEESLAALDQARLDAFRDWMDNGGGPTLRALQALSQEEREDILEYLLEFELYAEVKVGGRIFVLVHAGLGNFAPDKALDDYTPEEFLFGQPERTTTYDPDKLVIHGHTPTRLLSGEDKILRHDTWIDIDCGCGLGGPLGCLCLDTLEEYYA